MTEKGKFSPHALPISGLSPPRGVGCLGIGRSAQTPDKASLLGAAFSLMRHHKTAEQGSSLASRRVCHSFTQIHHRVSKVRQKMSILRRREAKALSLLTLS